MNGLQETLNHLGLTRENSIAFGDGGNDTEMLAFAGIGVAMGNAWPDARAAADNIGRSSSPCRQIQTADPFSGNAGGTAGDRLPGKAAPLWRAEC